MSLTVVTGGLLGGSLAAGGFDTATPIPPGVTTSTFTLDIGGFTGNCLITGGFGFGNSTAVVTASPIRDRTILAMIKGLLDGTSEFDEVTTWGLPESIGSTASNLTLASLELGSFTEENLADDDDALPLLRTVQFVLTLHVRNPDPDVRDNELDRLANVASNAYNGETLGNVLISFKSHLSRGQWMESAGVERRMRLIGTFAYVISDWGTHNTDP